MPGFFVVTAKRSKAQWSSRGADAGWENSGRDARDPGSMDREGDGVTRSDTLLHPQDDHRMPGQFAGKDKKCKFCQCDSEQSAHQT